MKITITIEDTPGGRVKCIASPSFETMAKMIVSGEESTAAMGYAMKVINTVRDESKRVGSKLGVLIPKLIVPN